MSFSNAHNNNVRSNASMQPVKQASAYRAVAQQPQANRTQQSHVALVQQPQTGAGQSLRTNPSYAIPQNQHQGQFSNQPRNPYQGAYQNPPKNQYGGEYCSRDQQRVWNTQTQHSQQAGMHAHSGSVAQQDQKSTPLHVLGTVLGILALIILVPMLIVNITIIVKSMTGDTRSVPSAFGYFPMVVLTDSMNSGSSDEQIASGDLIFCKTTDPSSVQVGDVISFFDPASSSDAVVTHQVVDIKTLDDGTRQFTTKGTANNTNDAQAVPEANVCGVYTGVKITGAGHVVLWLQSTTGIVVVCGFIGVLVVASVLLNRRSEKKEEEAELSAMQEELTRLRSQNYARRGGARHIR